MAKFNYEAVDKAGRQKNGSIDAGSVEEAREKLKKKSLFPTTINPVGAKKKKSGDPDRKRTSALMAGGVSGKDLTLFTRQFATLIDAGLPMVRSLDILEQMLKPGGLRNAVMDVRDEVEQGSGLSDSMAKCPAAFDELYISMIKAGEASGLLGRILERLAEFREKSEKLRREIIGALVYPAAVIFIAGSILTLIMIFIVPQFEQMFNSMQMEMPAMTQTLINLSAFLSTHALLVILMPFLLAIAMVMIRKTKQGKYVTDMMSLYIPVFGTIIKKSTVSRFCRTLGELTNAGVPILDALAILQTAVGNAVVADAVADIHAAIREGENIADPMKRSGVFDLMVVNMVEVGEETGELDKMLIKISNMYDDEVDALVGTMMSLLEPILIVGMGAAVGFIVIALFMPLVNMISSFG